MANEDQLRLIRQDVGAWNKWREEHPDDKVDLSGANLGGAILWKANLVKADLWETNLSGANLVKANLSGARLWEAKLVRADLWLANLNGADFLGADLAEAILQNANLDEADFEGANLFRADLSEANLWKANLSGADLTDADLSRADLSRASLIGTTLVRTKLTGCRIYGISTWDLKIDDTMQSCLIITPQGDPNITVDNLQVAQFIYLLLHNEDIRQVIDTITSKVVLILGRFTRERKVVLDSIRDELRRHDYLPVMFDFDKPASRDLTETISTLAHMARFIIADITEASAVPVELERVVPGLPSVPIVILIHCSNKEYALFDHIRRYPWVIEPYRYEDQAELIASIGKRVIAPAEIKVKEYRSP